MDKYLRNKRNKSGSNSRGNIKHLPRKDNKALDFLQKRWFKSIKVMIESISSAFSLGFKPARRDPLARLGDIDRLNS